MKVKELHVLTLSLVLISTTFILLLGSTTIWNGPLMQAQPESKVLSSRRFNNSSTINKGINHLHNAVVDPTSSHPKTLKEKHVLANMEKCWKAINMTGYLMETGYNDLARHYAIHTMRTINKFVPDVFHKKSRNHCWNMNVTTVLKDSFIGRIDSYNFQVNPNTLQPYFVGKAQKHFPSFSSSSVCLPEAFLAGFPKCGSKLLYNLLISHPSIIEPVYKEPHWWVNKNSFWPVDSELVPAQLAAYLHNFGRLIMQDDSRTLLTIDATPSIMFDMPGDDLKTKVVNVCLLPALIPEILPKSKFIVVMRDPVERLYSGFWYLCTRRGGSIPMEIQLKGPDIFHKRVISKVNKIKSCKKKFPLAKCVVDATPDLVSSNHILSCGKMSRNTEIFYVYIKKWLSVVPREKFLFLTVEELFSKPDVVMGRIWKFLDIPPFRGYQSVLSDPKIVHQQHIVDYHHNPRLQMRNDTREILQQFFHPFNQKLADLLGDEKFLW